MEDKSKISSYDEISANFSETSETVRGVSVRVDVVATAQSRLETALAELSEDIKKLTGWSYSNVGSLKRSIGRVTETVVISGARPALSRLGHDYDEVIPNLVGLSARGETIYEIDLLMLNGTSAMALEIKSTLKSKGVDEYLKKLEIMRQDEFRLDIKDKALYGCLAGIKIEKSAKKRALDAGIYVLEIVENENRLNAFAPEAGKVGKW